MKKINLLMLFSFALLGCAFMNSMHGADRHPVLPPSISLVTSAEVGILADVRQHIDAGTDVNLPDHCGDTALMMAARRGHTEIVLMLLDAGAQVDHADYRGRTALQIAAEYGHIAVVRTLLERCADVNHADHDGVTALKRAAEYGHIAIVQMLLKRGANVNRANCNGTTALISAASSGHTEIVQALLKRGADVNRADHCRRTALKRAAGYGHIAVVRMLLERGAEVNLADRDGRTALMSAAVYSGNAALIQMMHQFPAVDHTAIMRMLLRHRTKEGRNELDRNARDNDGLTALHLVITSDDKIIDSLHRSQEEMVECVRALLYPNQELETEAADGAGACAGAPRAHGDITRGGLDPNARVQRPRPL